MLMMLEKPRRTPAEGALATLAQVGRRTAMAIDGALSWPFHAIENRRTLTLLAGLDDHALRDMGLTRHDLNDAISLPAAQDPTRFLAERRDERRPRH